MKAIEAIVAICLVLAGSTMAARAANSSNPKDIAANPESIVAAIKNQDAKASATLVAKTLAAIQASNWSDAKKRESSIALITYAVAAKGMESGPMMSLVAGLVPPQSISLVAATAVVAAGDNSSSVAEGMLAAVAANTQASEACQAACSSPTTVLLPTEVGVVRGIILPTPTQAPAKAPPLPTIIPEGPSIVLPGEKYPGQ